MSKVDSEAWVLAAAGQLGDLVYWEDGFEVIERARNLLCSLEEIGKEKVDWWYLLQGLPDLSVIETMSFPPLYSENAFEEIDGFLTITEDPENDDIACMSFDSIQVYIDPENMGRLLDQFKKLTDRLENYEPLEPYV